jgi:hypothetical protein
MLSYCRPSGTYAEQQFCKVFLDPLDPYIDPIGNYHVTVGENSKVMWSCHIDTVHHRPGRQKIRQRKEDNLFVATSQHSNCLGADDTAGVWLMVNLIRAGVPGHYIFHFGEEIGCVGAGFLKNYKEELIKTFDMSIALDRAGTTSCVTAQSGQVCASDAFAKELCAQLDMAHRPDPGGVWTDNFEYVDLVPEIVNLSVGYRNQHTSYEVLDGEYLQRLLAALVKVDYSSLPIERDPTAPSYSTWGSHRTGYGTGINSFGYDTDYDLDSSYPKGEVLLIHEFVKEWPYTTAELLFEYGFTYNDLQDFLWKDKEPQGESPIPIDDDDLWGGDVCDLTGR